MMTQQVSSNELIIGSKWYHRHVSGKRVITTIVGRSDNVIHVRYDNHSDIHCETVMLGIGIKNETELQRFSPIANSVLNPERSDENNHFAVGDNVDFYHAEPGWWRPGKIYKISKTTNQAQVIYDNFKASENGLFNGTYWVLTPSELAKFGTYRDKYCNYQLFEAHIASLDDIDLKELEKNYKKIIKEENERINVKKRGRNEFESDNINHQSIVHQSKKRKTVHCNESNNFVDLTKDSPNSNETNSDFEDDFFHIEPLQIESIDTQRTDICINSDDDATFPVFDDSDTNNLNESDMTPPLPSATKQYFASQQTRKRAKGTNSKKMSPIAKRLTEKGVPKNKKNAQGLIECIKCGKSFKSSAGWCNHWQNEHQRREDWAYQCEFCKNMFPTSQKRLKHIRKVHDTNY